MSNRNGLFFFYPKRKERYLYGNLVVVPVIALFSKDGKMILIYFSVEGIKIKVDRVIWAKENLAWGVIISVESV